MSSISQLTIDYPYLCEFLSTGFVIKDKEDREDFDRSDEDKGCVFTRSFD